MLFSRSSNPNRFLSASMGILLAVMVMATASGCNSSAGDPGAQVPRGPRVAALIQVKARPQKLIGSGSVEPFNVDQYRMHRQTQVELIRSPRVIRRALRQQDNTQYTEEWVWQNLFVTCPEDCELIAVGMKCSRRDEKEMIALVDDIVDAYFDEIVSSEKREREDELDILTRRYLETDRQINNLTRDIIKLRNTIGPEVESAELENMQFKKKTLERLSFQCREEIERRELESSVSNPIQRMQDAMKMN